MVGILPGHAPLAAKLHLDPRPWTHTLLLLGPPATRSSKPRPKLPGKTGLRASWAGAASPERPVTRQPGEPGGSPCSRWAAAQGTASFPVLHCWPPSTPISCGPLSPGLSCPGLSCPRPPPAQRRLPQRRSSQLPPGTALGEPHEPAHASAAPLSAGKDSRPGLAPCFLLAVLRWPVVTQQPLRAHLSVGR